MNSRDELIAVLRNTASTKAALRAALAEALGVELDGAPDNSHLPDGISTRARHAITDWYVQTHGILFHFNFGIDGRALKQLLVLLDERLREQKTAELGPPQYTGATDAGRKVWESINQPEHDITADELLITLQAFLQNMPKWWQQNFSLPAIVRNFNQIYTSIISKKNGNNRSNNNRSSAAGADGISDDFRRAVLGQI